MPRLLTGIEWCDNLGFTEPMSQKETRHLTVPTNCIMGLTAVWELALVRIKSYVTYLSSWGTRIV